MAITIGNNQPMQGKSTIQIVYSADTDRVTNILRRLALVAYRSKRGLVGPGNQFVDFSDLTNQQKLNLIDNLILKRLITWSRNLRKFDAEKSARDDVFATLEEDQLE